MTRGRWVHLALMVVCAAGSTGCTDRSPAAPPSAPAPATAIATVGPRDAQALVAGQTVEFIQRWALERLLGSDDAASTPPPDTPITEEQRRAALEYAAGLAGRNPLACRAARVRLVGTRPYRLQVEVADCPYGSEASPEAGRASARACLLPLLPTGSYGVAGEQYATTGGGPPPRQVDAAAQARPGTWYLGDCAVSG